MDSDPGDRPRAKQQPPPPPPRAPRPTAAERAWLRILLYLVLCAGVLGFAVSLFTSGPAFQSILIATIALAGLAASAHPDD